MRLVIQRVLSAGVKVDGEFISQIGPGICVLLGLHRGDSLKQVDKWAEKLLKLKLWPQKIKQNDNQGDQQEEGQHENNPREAGGWKSNILENNYEVLIVSNFTLYGILKGNKPDFHDSMNADEAKAIYEYFIKKMQQIYQPEKVKGGKFQHYMNVHIVGDGPVTLILEDNNQEDNQKEKQNSNKQQEQDQEESKNETVSKSQMKKQQKQEKIQQKKQHNQEQKQQQQNKKHNQDQNVQEVQQVNEQNEKND